MPKRNARPSAAAARGATRPAGRGARVAIAGLATLVMVAFGAASAHGAQADCVFDEAPGEWTLSADCATDHTIVVPPDVNVDGAGHRILALDRADASFDGPVLSVRGGAASFVRLAIDGSALGGGCREGAHGLAGIRVERASVSLTDVTIEGIGRADGRCDEGVGVEVIGLVDSSLPPPSTPEVRLRRVAIRGFQKGGIVALGRQRLVVEESQVGASQAQSRLAANGIQVGLQTVVRLERSVIAGNSWCCAGPAATAVLLVDAGRGSVVRNNRLVGGNADVGIFLLSDQVLVESNFLVDEGVDGVHDVGILNRGAANVVKDNLVVGFDVAYEGPPESWIETAARRSAADEAD
ncbi:MAG: right-handed parallel beta-helix repeat-containing protein [Vicinamibacterales bacterium]